MQVWHLGNACTADRLVGCRAVGTRQFGPVSSDHQVGDDEVDRGFDRGRKQLREDQVASLRIEKEGGALRYYTAERTIRCL